jgi:hypothetical protein
MSQCSVLKDILKGMRSVSLPSPWLGSSGDSFPIALKLLEVSFFCFEGSQPIHNIMTLISHSTVKDSTIRFLISSSHVSLIALCLLLASQTYPIFLALVPYVVVALMGVLSFDHLTFRGSSCKIFPF